MCHRALLHFFLGLSEFKSVKAFSFFFKKEKGRGQRKTQKYSKTWGEKEGRASKGSSSVYSIAVVNVYKVGYILLTERNWLQNTILLRNQPTEEGPTDCSTSREKEKLC